MNAGDIAWLWNQHPQLAVKKELHSVGKHVLGPQYEFYMYGAECFADHAQPAEQGHPARDLIHELQALFPKEHYGHSALSLGQAAILLDWVRTLPVVFLDETESVVKVSIQDGAIIIEERK